MAGNKFDTLLGLMRNSDEANQEEISQYVADKLAMKVMYVKELTSSPASVTSKPNFDIKPTLQTDDNTLYHYYDKTAQEDKGYWKWNGTAMVDTGHMLQPMVMYIWGTININGHILNLETEDPSTEQSSRFCEYMFQFTNGSTYVPTLITSFEWFILPTMEKGITYQISVCNNVAAFINNASGQQA